MKCVVHTVAFALTSIALQVVPAAAQPLPPGLTNPMIQIEYVVPKKAAYRPIHDRLRQRQVLERLRVFLAPLRLPKPLQIKIDECGTPLVPYRTGAPVVVCYEYIEQVENLSNRALPAASYIGLLGQVVLSKDQTIIGPVVHVLLNNVSRGLFDVLDLPVWGNIEDAADHIAAYLMLQFGKDVAQKTLFGTAWFLLSSATQSVNFADIRPTLQQRYYNHLCLAFGKDPITYGIFVPYRRTPTVADLPTTRAGGCAREYGKVKDAFAELVLANNVDLDLLKKVQALEWLKDD